MSTENVTAEIAAVLARVAAVVLAVANAPEWEPTA